ncbi:hypothetical protein Pint_04671 [Pistacia integerrima]|uniref:Uncharacterized protein n=1 Tax=Pistacia integerrima TaxID=434235 RepID=A0ACC0Z2G8_9ROSI|nr:hypothetical protein Pint_04671 [Pistacia integerrima]
MNVLHVVSFLSLLLPFMFPANGTTTINRNAHTLTVTNGRVEGVMGAIVNNSSRIGNEEQLAMEMAVQDFNNYTNQTLVLHIRNSRGEPVTAALAAMDLISTQHAEAIVGPQTWEEVSVVAQFGNEKDIPVLTC